MKIAVIGAGIVGVSTAFELASLHHEVSVFERHYATAEECSFANAGILSSYEVAPFARPGLFSMALIELFKQRKSIQINKGSWHQFKWLNHMRGASKANTFTERYRELLALQQYSLTCLNQFRQQSGFEVDQTQGHLVLLRGEREQALAQPALEILSEAGVHFQLVDPLKARDIEPALHPETAFEQGIYLPEDESTNCRQFTQQLKLNCENMGVKFIFSTQVDAIETHQGARLWINHKAHDFDAVVVCAGVASEALVKPLGIKLPMRTVAAHSISANVREILDAPRNSIMDERYKTSIVRLGQRVRVSGALSLGNTNKHQANSLKTLYQVLEDWFPGAARTHEHLQIWHASMPITADEKPVIGASGVAGVWLNVGHGQSGWAFAMGSARTIARQISGRQDDIDVSAFKVHRFK